MNKQEIRTGISLAAIYGLRMLGLFLILPVFAISAKGLPGGDNLTLVGLALGAYGLSQALLQIPFGMASDRYGRKPIIVIGLIIYALGSFIAALAPNIYIMIIGRIIQGSGAISATVSALAADLTREQHRTKVMAMIGSTIGLVFALSMIIAPALDHLIGLAGLFSLTGFLALGAIVLLLRVVPDLPNIPTAIPTAVPTATHTAPSTPHSTPTLADEKIKLRDLLRHPELLRLNVGIFTLHLIQMSLFVVLPAKLIVAGNLPLESHWKIYLPVILASFALMVPPLFYAERLGRVKRLFTGSVAFLFIAQVGFLWGNQSFIALTVSLLVFFVAFNILEASLPSLISRIAPSQARGAAMGVYNTTQAFGLFLGGALGGLLAKYSGPQSVFLLDAVLALIWLCVAGGMKAPPSTREKKNEQQHAHSH